MTWSPAHLAVEHEDLPRLRELLDAGHDVEDDNGDGWTLLRHALDVEHDAHVQTDHPLQFPLSMIALCKAMRRTKMPVASATDGYRLWYDVAGNGPAIIFPAAAGATA